MMCFPSIDSLVKKVDTKYTLVTLAALRARELTNGEEPLIDGTGKKVVTVALEEIYRDKITYARLTTPYSGKV
jgi:DNA-directed RNA polymerase subunit omega